MLEEGIINESNTNPKMIKLYKVFCKAYPVLNLSIQLLNFGYNAKYMLKNDFAYFGWDYHILGHKVSRQQLEEAATPGKFGFLVDILKKNFIFVIYLGTKLLEWYFDINRKKEDIFERAKGEVKAPFEDSSSENKMNICQLCHKVVTIPCCLDTCGYVFCQSCIFDYIQKVKKCPITQVDCTVDNIHKIFVN
jgi:hypothetical protein